jgi:5-methylcytosine-specific restriction endonuclease McrA
MRPVLRKVKAPTAAKAIPSKVRHAVNLRDRGKCQVKGCTNERYVDLHHIIHQAKGGKHTEENLVTLCSAHHRIQHRSFTAGR